MIHVTAQTAGAQEDLVRTRNRIAAAGARSWLAATKTALRFMQRNGYFDRTGTLTKSMRYTFVSTGFLQFRSEVIASASYALFVDQPTRPHEIVARRAPFLRFYWGPPKGPGAVVFFKKVQHPGTRGALFSDMTRKHMIGRFQVGTQVAIDAVGGVS